MRAPTPDPYQVLGVSRESSEEQIREAYKKLVKTHHPDLHLDEKKKADAEEECKKLNAAADILLDKDKKAAYDTPSPQFNATDPMAAFFHAFGGRMGFNVFGGTGGATFSFRSQRVINCEAEMTLADCLLGNKEFEIQSAAGKVVIDLPKRTSPGQSINICIKKDVQGETVLRVQMRLRMPTKELTPEQSV